MNLTKYTALYSDLDIEYNQTMSGAYEDLSFRSDDTIIIAGLKDNKITGFWRPMVAFGNEKVLKEKIIELYNICPDIYFQDFLIDGKLSPVSKFLLGRGYKAAPYYTQIIDLTKTKEQLHSELRKSYKSLVNKNPTISVMWNIKPYERLCSEVRGGQARSVESWFVQQRMIWKKQLFCLLQSKLISLGNTWSLAGGLFYYNDYCCYYGSGCFSKGINGHNILWQAILHAKGLGCKQFEMGEQVFGNDKLANISKFKRGFGGTCKIRLNLRKEE